MSPRTIRSLALASVMVGFAATSSACYVEEEAPPPVYVEGYEPMYYDGYVVYYDDVGRPFYYVNGVVYWVPPTSPVYVGLVRHWRTYGPGYRHWYGNYGYRYRGYRYRGYRGYYHGYRR
jgi:hypothetical protein